MLQAFSEENNQIITLQVTLNFMYSQGFPYHNLSCMVIFISPLKLSIQQIQHGSDALGYTPTGDRMEGGVDLVHYQEFTTLKCMMKRG